VALFLVSACLWAQAPSGWKTLRSVKQPVTTAGPVVRDGKCSIAVPTDWTERNTTDRSQAEATGGMIAATAFIQQWPVGPNKPTFAARKDFIVKDLRKQKADVQRGFHKDALDVRILEDTPTRLKVMKVTTPYAAFGGATEWTLLSAGDPICYAQVFAADASAAASPADRADAQRLHAVAERIVATFTAAK
jgi:hypothetical protein